MKFSKVFIALAGALMASCASYKSSYVYHDDDSEVQIGYGSVSKDQLTGAVSGGKVDAKTVGHYSNIYDYLRGRYTGLEVMGSGSSAKLRIRGEGSNSNMSDPLVLVDGVEVTDLSTINPNNVSSVEVIKDATAAIYGVRGANGIVLISTKR